MARDRFLTNATDDLPETGTKRHAPTIQDLYLLPNQGAEAIVSGSRDGRVWEQRRSRLGAEADADGAKFADKLGICIYEASGGAATSLV